MGGSVPKSRAVHGNAAVGRNQYGAGRRISAHTLRTGIQHGQRAELLPSVPDRPTAAPGFGVHVGSADMVIIQDEEDTLHRKDDTLHISETRVENWGGKSSPFGGGNLESTRGRHSELYIQRRL